MYLSPAWQICFSRYISKEKGRLDVSACDKHVCAPIVKIDIDDIEGERFPFVFFRKVNILFIILDCRKSVRPFYFVCILLKNGK